MAHRYHHEPTGDHAAAIIPNLTCIDAVEFDGRIHQTGENHEVGMVPANPQRRNADSADKCQSVISSAQCLSGEKPYSDFRAVHRIHSRGAEGLEADGKHGNHQRQCPAEYKYPPAPTPCGK